ncbi:MAG: antibiotic biosynthesis monooxygenase [Dehalococcoidia bacterium]
MAPHVTHFKMKAKPGERQRIIDLFDRWFRDRRPVARGFVRGELSSNVNDPDEFMAVACFADKATYDANSNDPDQTAWYEELRSYLVADPEWFDGTLEKQKVG